MAERELVGALAECLEALRAGGLGLEACLERHGAYRAELEALLEVARLIPRFAEAAHPSPSFVARTRRLLVGPTNGDASPPSGPGWQDADPSST